MNFKYPPIVVDCETTGLEVAGGHFAVEVAWWNLITNHRLWDLSPYADGVMGLDYLPGLADVCERLGVPAPDHTAEGDVSAAGQCLLELRSRVAVTVGNQGE